jgi:hypothetical protein
VASLDSIPHRPPARESFRSPPPSVKERGSRGALHSVGETPASRLEAGKSEQDARAPLPLSAIRNLLAKAFGVRNSSDSPLAFEGRKTRIGMRILTAPNIF